MKPPESVAEAEALLDGITNMDNLSDANRLDLIALELGTAMDWGYRGGGGPDRALDLLSTVGRIVAESGRPDPSVSNSNYRGHLSEITGRNYPNYQTAWEKEEEGASDE